MRIKTLSLKNFRGIRELTFDDLDPKLNVIVGVNGAGKSSILDCAAVLLSRLIWRIRSTHGTGRLFNDFDITNGATETVNTISVTVSGRNVQWQVAKTREGRKQQTITNLADVTRTAETVKGELEKDSKASLPLAVYYPVNRAVLDIPLRIRKKHTFEQLSAYDQALTGSRSDFRLFFEWFRFREDIENERKVRSKSKAYSDRELDAVREAIETFLPNVADLHIQRTPLRMVLRKGETEVFVNQLSDGEKCLMAMVGDLARRLSIANPALENPSEGEAIVLIDELDLHLHPSWQRLVIPNLSKTFPNCQFILTTHSAQILSDVQPEKILLLDTSGEDIRLERPQGAYGLDSNRILEDIMGVPERRAEIKEKIKHLFRVISDGHLAKAKSDLSKLQNEIGTDPELVKAGVLIRRQEIQRG
jgi:predicted ATP-binding protein involved in virulence